MTDELNPATENTASEKAVRKARQRQRQSRADELKDLRALTSTTQGRRLARRIIAKCGVFTQAEVESTNRVLVNEGRRAVGLWLIAELEAADPASLQSILFTSPTERPTHGH